MKLTQKTIGNLKQEIDAFDFFNRQTEKQWADELESYRVYLEMDSHEREHTYDYRVDLYADISSNFPQLKRQSQLLLLVALFEDGINKICRALRDDLHLELALKDMSGSGLERAKLYLSKGAGLKLDFGGSSWHSIIDAQAIRNLIAHSGARIALEAPKKMMQAVGRQTDVHLNEFGGIKICAGYSQNVSEVMQQFLSHMYRVASNLP